MNSIVEINEASKKQWLAPELKKINIEEVTANNTGTGADTLGHS
jgi:hypothetical protein